MSKVTLVVPEAPVPAAALGFGVRLRTPSDFVRSLTPNPGGLRLGVLDNSKGNADHLLNFIVEGVKAALPVASVVMTRKGSVSLPAPGEVLDQLTREADFVVSAMAD